ncbi:MULTISPECIES: hypothetical protein [Acetobacter]|uniref:Uncharacterized protein n=1 Tax=Acetobacter thailandicus TaxID=1502842 RepID=A0ABT3QH43_9PROT|nr:MULTISPECIES: hypothetical protein [Acetobacter]MBS0981513.1 hypothetical protein [Acetobacter thailandicus]MBS0986304.1 hypothetical protein [Acetobacter thailandicus]MCX2564602.1 hypothetical protein [Acetobacter thailandicus]NHN95932.1 hypothetical protein [Acetobacter thailandicus]
MSGNDLTSGIGGIARHESALKPAEMRAFLFLGPALSGTKRYRQAATFYGMVHGTD